MKKCGIFSLGGNQLSPSGLLILFFESQGAYYGGGEGHGYACGEAGGALVCVIEYAEKQRGEGGAYGLSHHAGCAEHAAGAAAAMLGCGAYKGDVVGRLKQAEAHSA